MVHSERQPGCVAPLLLTVAAILLLSISPSAAAQLTSTRQPKSLPAQHAEIRRAIADAEKLRSAWTAESFQKATEKYRSALRLLNNAKDDREKARVLRALAELSSILGNYREALAFYENSLRIAQDLKDYEAQAETLNGVSFTHLYTGDIQKALDYGKRALALAEQHQNRRIEAEALNNMAEAYNLLGDLKSAISLLDRVQLVSRDETDIRGQARAATTAGEIEMVKGDGQKAIGLFNKALDLWRAINDRHGEAYTTQLLASQMVFGGDFQQALNFAGQALDLFRTIGDGLGEAVATSRIGYTYLSLGEPRTTLGYYKKAASIYKRLSLQQHEATILADLADVYRLLGDQKLALTMCQTALALIKQTDDKLWEALTLISIGTLHLDNRDRKNALDAFTQAESLLRNLDNPRWEAEAHKGLGLVYFGQGNDTKALESFGHALSLARTASDPSGESLLLHNIALVERRRGNLEAARLRIEEALRIVDSVRAKVASRDSRASYFASMHQQFELYVDVLMSLHAQQPNAGFDIAAFEASEKWRSRSLLEMLSNGRTDNTQGVDEALLRKERTLAQQLRTAMDRRIELLSEKASAQQLANVETELDTLVADYQRLQVQIAASNPRYASITQPAALSHKEIQQQILDPDTLLLEYALGEERSFVWAITTNSIRTVELPSRAQIEKTTRRVYELLTARNRDVPGETGPQRQARIVRSEQELIERSNELSAILLKPVAGELGHKRILIVADGALHYLPFAMLPATSFTPLVVEHEVVTLPSASVLALIRKELNGRKPAPKSLAILADPVFDKTDERLRFRNSLNTRRRTSTDLRQSEMTAARRDDAVFDSSRRALRDFNDQEIGNGIARLPFSRREAEAIMGSASTKDAMLALGFRANRATATAPELSQYRIVHFATHGLLNSKHPELSGILLSLYDDAGKHEDGFLQLPEIYNLNLPADLVVLSACQTALGKDIRGEGLVGLTRGFMYAGAARVVASLWQIDDAATADLMGEFYRAMLKEGMRPAEALRAAQVHMWKQKQWSSPYYWAAFTLQGEWR